jgi:hypothetical protein
VTFDEARDALSEGYSALGLSATLSGDGRTIYLKRGEDAFRIVRQDIEEYASDSELFDVFETVPAECSICSGHMREQPVNYLGSHRYRYRPPFMGDEIVFGDKTDSFPFAVIGKASRFFSNYFRFDETFAQLSLARMRRRSYYLRHRELEKDDIRAYRYDPTTIRVDNLQENSVDAALRASSALIDGCLFHLSYLQDLPLGLMEEWPKSTPREFRLEERKRQRELSLPSVRFNADVVKLYQRGMGAEDPVTQFLSFYQVLEYFFISVTDEQLYARLSSRISDPAFSTTPRKLDSLIQDVLDHGRTTDELEMLKAVLRKHVSENELIHFISEYEDFLDERAYTKRRKIFGKEVGEVKLEEGHVFGNIARRVKVLRNALVHSSDRYERGERFVPLTAAHEKTVRREIPLVRFLAERIVIATSRA